MPPSSQAPISPLGTLDGCLEQSFCHPREKQTNKLSGQQSVIAVFSSVGSIFWSSSGSSASLLVAGVCGAAFGQWLDPPPPTPQRHVWFLPNVWMLWGCCFMHNVFSQAQYMQLGSRILAIPPSLQRGCFSAAVKRPPRLQKVQPPKLQLLDLI